MTDTDCTGRTGRDTDVSLVSVGSFDINVLDRILEAEAPLMYPRLQMDYEDVADVAVAGVKANANATADAKAKGKAMASADADANVDANADADVVVYDNAPALAKHATRPNEDSEYL
jgi:hypothetical protein